MANDGGMAEVMKAMREGQDFGKAVTKSQGLNSQMIRDMQTWELTEQKKFMTKVKEAGGIKCPNCKKYNVTVTTAIIDEKPVHYGMCLNCAFGKRRSWIVKKIK